MAASITRSDSIQQPCMEHTIVEVLGEGAYGIVYKVECDFYHRPCAIKKINYGIKRTEEDTMSKEVNLLSKLSRKNTNNIVQYYCSWFATALETKPEKDKGRIKINIPSSLRKKHLNVGDTDDDDISDEDDDEDYSSPCCKADQGSPVEVRYLHILMEYCENSTLKELIDNGLDEKKAAQLFKEILEGLSFIHKEKIIHRDLKPSNIFIDLNGRAKIGDFGVATETILREINYNSASVQGSSGSKSSIFGSEMYLAPEVLHRWKPYTDKIDVYSLGIIYFEMLYPMSTGYEKCKVLTELRKKEIQFPGDWNNNYEEQQTMIKKLLDHDVSKRPTSKKLHQEVCKIDRSLLNLLADLKKPILSHYFSKASDVEDTKKLNDIDYNFIMEQMIKVFKSHGGKPLLIHSLCYKNELLNGVRLLTESGNVVYFPSHVRDSFIKHIVQNDVSKLRRYTIDKVYKHNAQKNNILQETYECSFDIVSSEPNANKDADILCILEDIARKIGNFKSSKVYIRINYFPLIKAIFSYLNLNKGIENLPSGDKWDINGLLKNVDVPNLEYIQLLFSHEFSITSLLRWLDTCNIPPHVKFEADALSEIIMAAERQRPEINIKILLKSSLNARYYSGMMCQLVSNQGKITHILASGGRYDRAIKDYGLKLKKHRFPSAVGVLIFLNRFATSLSRESGKAKEIVPKNYFKSFQFSDDIRFDFQFLMKKDSTDSTDPKLALKFKSELSPLLNKLSGPKMIYPVNKTESIMNILKSFSPGKLSNTRTRSKNIQVLLNTLEQEVKEYAVIIYFVEDGTYRVF